MANYETELTFCGQFMRYAENDADQRAWSAMELVRSEMFEDRELGAIYEAMCRRLASGNDLVDPTTDGTAAWFAVMDNTIGELNLGHFADRIRKNHLARRQVDLLRKGLAAAEDAVPSTNGKARKVADRLSMALLNLFAEGSENGAPASLGEMADAAIASIGHDQDPGVDVPLEKLNEECGPWLPGDVIGVSAYSNGGKSTFIANLATRWARRGQPVLVFPTEMRQQWLDRANCTLSGVRQRIAEKRQWKRATANEISDYRDIMAAFKLMPFEIVNRPNISPVEIIAATRVIRRRWADRPVIVIVDHMHRLDYGAEEANKMVGQATKMMKNFAGDAGIVFVLLFQPRKPDKDTYRPIAGHQIRGDSSVWNEIDIHLSPFRAFVKPDAERETKWGTPGAMLDRFGRPFLEKPTKKGAVLSDEFLFLKVDKRRIGGEGGTLIMHFDQPSGAIHEITTEHPSLL